MATRPEQRRELAVVLLAVSGSVMTNLVVNGLSEVFRAFVLVLMLVLFALGLWFLSEDLDLPLILRSKRWAEHERQQIMNNPAHALYAAYWGNASGFIVHHQQHDEA